MLKSIKIVNDGEKCVVRLKDNADGAHLELRKIEAVYDDHTDTGYTFVWVNKDGVDYPKSNIGQVIMSKNDIANLFTLANATDWFD